MGSAEDAMKKRDKRRIVASISTFYFSNLYTKLPRKKLSMVHNSLTNFCFGEGEKITNIKDNVIYLNKHQIKDAVVHLLLNWYSTIGPKILCDLIGVPMWFDTHPFFANLFLYSYENKRIEELKKNDIIKVGKLCNVFRFINDLKSFLRN